MSVLLSDIKIFQNMIEINLHLKNLQLHRKFFYYLLSILNSYPFTRCSGRGDRRRAIKNVFFSGGSRKFSSSLKRTSSNEILSSNSVASVGLVASGIESTNVNVYLNMHSNQ